MFGTLGGVIQDLSLVTCKCSIEYGGGTVAIKQQHAGSQSLSLVSSKQRLWNPLAQPLCLTLGLTDLNVRAGGDTLFLNVRSRKCTLFPVSVLKGLKPMPCSTFINSTIRKHLRYSAT
ncbi:hypothetical protein NPIL_426981 [Nephila pilipes]|uniref:Uncharacterized protein n=1 Tax=Nephila pilipes TaxID=299642 RepID=A0A8X6QP21_NEPPI|nr:hypothetical protein NPIL_426981 [Nephila pilipes]